VLENWALRRIFGPKRDEVKGGYRKLHEELHNLYCPLNIITTNMSRRMRLAGQVVWMGLKRNAYRILVGKPQRKRQIGRPRCRWVDNMKMELMRDSMGCYGLD
jgi:hypothetical protein